MNTDVHEYVSKSKRSCTAVVLKLWYARAFLVVREDIHQ